MGALINTLQSLLLKSTHQDLKGHCCHSCCQFLLLSNLPGVLKASL